MKIINSKYPDLQIDFDLEDCDNIMRIEGVDFCPIKIINVLEKKGFIIEILPD